MLSHLTHTCLLFQLGPHIATARTMGTNSVVAMFTVAHCSDQGFEVGVHTGTDFHRLVHFESSVACISMLLQFSVDSLDQLWR